MLGGTGRPGRHCLSVGKNSAKSRRKTAVLLNRGAGTLQGLDQKKTVAQIRETLEASGAEVSVEILDGPGIGEAVASHLKKGDVDRIVVGGGDGTVSASAAQLRSSKIALGIIPLGTMNLYARSLGLPLDLPGALKALSLAKPKPADAGDVGGRLFLHQVSFGLHPELVRTREKMNYGSRAGKIFATLRALIRTLRRPKLLKVKVEIDGKAREFRTPALVISNNLYGESHLPYADKVDEGVLGFYVCTSRKWSDLVQLTADVMLGSWANNKCVERHAGRAITIEAQTRRRKPLIASIDGELVPLAGRIELKTVPGALKVLVPATRDGKDRNKN